MISLRIIIVFISFVTVVTSVIIAGSFPSTTKVLNVIQIRDEFPSPFSAIFPSPASVPTDVSPKCKPEAWVEDLGASGYES